MQNSNSLESKKLHGETLYDRVCVSVCAHTHTQRGQKSFQRSFQIVCWLRHLKNEPHSHHEPSSPLFLDECCKSHFLVCIEKESPSLCLYVAPTKLRFGKQGRENIQVVTRGAFCVNIRMPICSPKLARGVWSGPVHSNLHVSSHCSYYVSTDSHHAPSSGIVPMNLAASLISLTGWQNLKLNENTSALGSEDSRAAVSVWGIFGFLGVNNHTSHACWGRREE